MLSSTWTFEQYKGAIIGYKIKDILFKEESDYQLVEILESEDYGKIMLLDGCMMVNEKDEFFYHETIAHMPMSLVQNAEKVLVLGGGDGGTVRELAKYSQIKEIILVEIDGKVIEASKKHLPQTACGFDDPRVKICVQDANEFLKTTSANSFDVIICDGSDPVGFAEILIQKNFYELIKKALKSNGVFITQSGSPLAQEEECKKTWKNLNLVFEHCNFAWSLVPCYPGAVWSFMLASKQDFGKYLNTELPKNCKFWNKEIFQALMSKPAFFTKLLSEN